MGGEYFRMEIWMELGQCVQGRLTWSDGDAERVAISDGHTALDVLLGLAASSALPPRVSRWLTNGAPKAACETGPTVAELQREVDGLRRMVDLLLDRLEGRRQ